MSAKGFRRCCDTPNQQSAPHLFGCTHHVASPVRVEVTQADRDAAAELHLVVSGNRSPFDYRCADTIRIGNSDHWPIVQAFARHRLATSPTPMLGEAGWRGIESAPKGDSPKDANGPPILIWRDGWPTGYEGFWYASDQAWYFANLDSEYGDSEYPTHWMPLPSPPQGGE